MEQMNKSIGDKERMIEWIEGKKVLDAGCGSGVLTHSLFNLGYDAYGIDLSMLSFKQMKERNLANRFVHGNLLDMSLYFGENEFDTIIFSSVLHEVYSYNGFNLQDIEGTLRNAMRILKKGGRIIIRDGVENINRHQKRIIRFKDLNDVLFLTEYMRRFKGRNVPICRKIDKLTYEMYVNDAMEFLYTYTWGWESFDREVQEQYGVMSLNEYMDLAQNIGGELLHAEQYLQSGYELNLRHKIEFFDSEMNHMRIPNSNMLLIIEK